MAAGRFSSDDVKYKVIDETTGTDNNIVALVLGKKVRVLAFSLTVGGASIMKWKSGFPAPTVDLTGPMPVGANKTIQGRFTEEGHFETGVTRHLFLSSSAAVVQGGWIVYAEVPG